MYKILNLIIFFLTPCACMAQFTITGRVVNYDDKKPIASASVFLSNATVGAKTNNNGIFTLHNAKPGKYQLIVSVVGFDTYQQKVNVTDGDIQLQTVELFPKTIILNMVTIKPVDDPGREGYLNWFRDVFLGTSDLARQCRIMNPEVLSFDYNDTTSTLTASATDLLQIENTGLGYRIRYLLTNFKAAYQNRTDEKIHYEGSALFEKMKGTPADERRWQKRRQQAYEGSEMHFLRAVTDDQISEEGFRVLQLARYANPDRPVDSLINAKIGFFKTAKPDLPNRRDSLSYWNRKADLPKILEKLTPQPLLKKDIISPTNQADVAALGCDMDALYITYRQDHYFYTPKKIENLSAWQNKENTLVNFNNAYAFVDDNGGVMNPNSLTFSGIWGRNRVAELLPLDYDAPQNTITQPIHPMEQADSTAEADNILKDGPSATAQMTEKAYLQFDRPYYAIGDTIYFKAYVTMGGSHLLSNISGVLHVDLVGPKDQVSRSLKLQLSDGVTWGDIALPDSLPGGNYHIRAYTRWMLNDTCYFDRPLLIAARAGKAAAGTLVSTNAKPDVQFFPEGGQFIAGIEQKVAFKAVGPNGSGITVTGDLLDDENKVINPIRSTHLGMGYFYLNAAEGKTYRAKVTYPNGASDTVRLPVAVARGITLAINNDAIPVAKVKIISGDTYFKENRNKVYSLIIYSGGTVKTMSVKLDSQTVDLDILKRRLHTGVATITLASPIGEPLSERLLFIQNYDQLNISAGADKDHYSKREKVKLKLNINDRSGKPAQGHFSVSVTDERKVPVSENAETTILSNLLLTSDLKGYVEQPNYYFNDTTTTIAKDLDVLMLTQGYRGFSWRQVLDNHYPASIYQTEKGLVVSGTLKDLMGKPIVGGTVTLVPAKGGTLLTATSGEKGIFHFEDLVFTDTSHFVLSAVNGNGKNSTKLTYSNEKQLPVPPLLNKMPAFTNDTLTAAYLANAQKQLDQNLDPNYPRNKMLKEVKITAHKKADDQYHTQSLAGAGHADQVMHADEIERVGGQLSTTLTGRLHGVNFSNGIPYLTSPPGGPMLVVVDGVEENNARGGYNIDQITSTQVETVEVLKYAGTAIYGMSGGNGVLVITTKQGGGRDIKDVVAIGVLPVNPIGFYKAREFYSPVYTHHDLAIKDLRSTIFWKPEVMPDQNGNAIIEFYNADSTGSYRVVVEGIDNKGNLGRRVYHYQVE